MGTCLLHVIERSRQRNELLERAHLRVTFQLVRQKLEKYRKREGERKRERERETEREREREREGEREREPYMLML